MDDTIDMENGKTKIQGPEGPLYGIIQKRLGRASRLDNPALKDLETDIEEKERAIASAIKEWKALSRSEEPEKKKGAVNLRGDLLLARIGSLRNGVNKDLMMIYQNGLKNMNLRKGMVGNRQYPDLYQSSPLAVILQRLGLPVLDSEIEENNHLTLHEGTFDGEDLLELMRLISGTGLYGSWTSFKEGFTRDEVILRSIGRRSMERTISLLKWVLNLMDKGDVVCRFSLSPGGPPDIRMGSMGVDGFVTMMPEDAGEMSQIKTLKIENLARTWVEEGFSIQLTSYHSYINPKRTAMDMMENVHNAGDHVIIRIKKAGAHREFIVDEISQVSRKIVMIDTLRPWGSDKILTLYGIEFDQLIREWSRAGYQMISFSI